MSITAPQTLLDTPVVGLPDLQRAVFYALFEGMNRALDQISAYWIDRDTQFNTVTGRSIEATTLEPIPNSNFHEGHKPSLINSEPANYPNVAVFANQAQPTPESDSFDQIESWSDVVLIEIMVKGDDEDTTNRRIQRTAEAVVMCLRRNPNLGGAIVGEISNPSIAISDLYAVRSPGQSGGYSPRILWQGAQITFRINKDSVRPLDGVQTFSESSETDYSQFIDQG